MDEFIRELKEELKKFEELKPPLWVNFVKSGPHRERPPQQLDFWYIRAASMLRKLAKGKPISVKKFRVIYGGRKNRGRRPEKFVKAGGKHIRLILQQLERIGFVKKATKGRVITSEGLKFLNRVWKKISLEG